MRNEHAALNGSLHLLSLRQQSLVLLGDIGRLNRPRMGNTEGNPFFALTSIMLDLSDAHLERVGLGVLRIIREHLVHAVFRSMPDPVQHDADLELFRMLMKVFTGYQCPASELLVVIPSKNAMLHGIMNCVNSFRKEGCPCDLK